MADKNFLTDIIDADLAEGKVKEIHTRFPPEPNGYMHIGHCKALIMDFLTAEKYGGHAAANQSDGIFTCVFAARA